MLISLCEDRFSRVEAQLLYNHGTFSVTSDVLIHAKSYVLEKALSISLIESSYFDSFKVAIAGKWSAFLLVGLGLLSH